MTQLLITPNLSINFGYQTDNYLHKRALEEGLSHFLLDTLKATLRHKVPSSQAGSAEGSGEGGVMCLLNPSVSCLLVLVSFNSSIRATLSKDREFLTTVLRGQLHITA